MMAKQIHENLEKQKSDIAFYLLREKIEDIKPFTIEIISNSMSPFLKAGDGILIKRISPGELKIGDIIVYQVNGLLCAHRYICSVKKDGRPIAAVTKGDNISDFDPYLISIDELLGKVTNIRRMGQQIDLQRPAWRKINFLIGISSFIQAFTIKVIRYPKSKLFKSIELSPLKKIIAFPFSAFIKSITNLARATL